LLTIDDGTCFGVARLAGGAPKHGASRPKLTNNLVDLAITDTRGAGKPRADGVLGEPQAGRAEGAAGDGRASRPGDGGNAAA